VLEVPQGFGSWFVWDKSGHIVTNFHVTCGVGPQGGWFIMLQRGGCFHAYSAWVGCAQVIVVCRSC
jgi:hypothetical protein